MATFKFIKTIIQLTVVLIGPFFFKPLIGPFKVSGYRREALPLCGRSLSPQKFDRVPAVNADSLAMTARTPLTLLARTHKLMVNTIRYGSQQENRSLLIVTAGAA
jgi:hypothetical protein